MRQALAGLLVGFIIAAAIPAGAHHGDAFRTLKERVNKLENRLDSTRENTRALDRRADGLEAFDECFSEAIAVSRYVGYMAQSSSGEQFTTSALDSTHPGDAVSAWIPRFDEACIQQSPREGRLRAHQR